jgi:hypothetical protein
MPWLGSQICGEKDSKGCLQILYIHFVHFTIFWYCIKLKIVKQTTKYYPYTIINSYRNLHQISNL